MRQPINTILPVRPREILREDFLEPLGVKINALVRMYGILTIWNYDV
jgi:plasmid maintenance system antidote protein VapI